MNRVRSIVQMSAGAVLVGGLSGLASAFFLVSLDFVTHVFNRSPSLVLLLPLAGLAVGLVYHRFGKTAERGTNLIIDEIHQPEKTFQRTLPFRMAPLVLFGTLATHLFGGSAGREGTAVQMGGAIADGVAKFLKIDGARRSLLLLSGMAGGFASVFGTPLAGAVFGLEVVGFRGIRGRLGFERVFACGLAAIVGHLTVILCNVHHTHYVIVASVTYTLGGFLTAALAGAAFGILGWSFARAAHGLGAVMQKIRYAPLRPVVGGVLVAALAVVFGLHRYLGLGVPVIVESLQSQVPHADFAWKFLMTVLTLGSGFKGGEVTPLFFIGSTFGNAMGATLSNFVSLPSPFLAALGFVAVFGGAANVPLASTLMAAELFGTEGLFYFATACYLSYFFSGRHGIYRSQRTFFFKLYS